MSALIGRTSGLIDVATPHRICAFGPRVMPETPLPGYHQALKGADGGGNCTRMVVQHEAVRD